MTLPHTVRNLRQAPVVSSAPLGPLARVHCRRIGSGTTGAAEIQPRGSGMEALDLLVLVIGACRFAGRQNSSQRRPRCPAREGWHGNSPSWCRMPLGDRYGELLPFCATRGSYISEAFAFLPQRISLRRCVIRAQLWWADATQPARHRKRYGRLWNISPASICSACLVQYVNHSALWRRAARTVRQTRFKPFQVFPKVSHLLPQPPGV